MLIKFNPTLVVAGMLTAACSVGSSRADVLVANLDQISNIVTPVGSLSSIGTVTATDFAGYVDVKVVLNNGALFVNTGGPGHSPFVFNLDQAPSSVVVVSPIAVNGNGSTGFAPDPASPLGENPWGNFTNGLLYVTYNNQGQLVEAGNGGIGHGNAGPLEFKIFGITVHDFVGNSGGYYFGADVLACVGVGGVTCTTGGVAANSVTIRDNGNQPGVPEASTWAMMLAGFLGMGMMAYRRRGSVSLFRVA